MKLCLPCVAKLCEVEHIHRRGAKSFKAKCESCGQETVCQEFTQEELVGIKQDGMLLNEIEKLFSEES